MGSPVVMPGMANGIIVEWKLCDNHVTIDYSLPWTSGEMRVAY